MNGPPPAEALRWAADAAGGRVVAVRELPSRWLANHALDLDDGRRLVLRRWARPGWDDDDPDLTADRERQVLTMLADSAVPAPRLVAADVDGEACDVPALLITRLVVSRPARPRRLTPRRSSRSCSALCR